MTSINSILAATDFSIYGNNAVQRAARLASELGAQLRILHVEKAPSLRSLGAWLPQSSDNDRKPVEALENLRRLANEISRVYDVTADVEIALGDPFEILMRAADGVDLVVLGRRGPRSLKLWCEGRTVDRMLRTCRRPVLVVKMPMPTSYHRVLVPIDFTATSDAAIRIADRIRKRSELHLFHAIESDRAAVLRDADVPEHIVWESRLMEEAEVKASMHRQVAELGLQNSRIRYALAWGRPQRTILAHSDSLQSDLIIAGRQGKSQLAGFLLGSVSSRLLADAICDVLIVPRPQKLSTASQTAAKATSRLRAELAPVDADRDERAPSSVGTPAAVSWMHSKPRFVSRRMS